ncbi:hypothetical protein Tco_0187396 [Tanacetum coccineum]
MLLGDLTIIWETAETSDDDFWKDQEEWEIIRWRFHESSGVHTLEIEDGTMIHVLSVEVISSSSWIITFSRHVAEKNNLFEAKTKIFEEMYCVQDTAQRMKLKRLKASTA